MVATLIKRLGVLSFFLSAVIASPLFEPGNLKARAGTYAITGARDGGVQPRLELRTLAADPIQWNLFLLAMIELQGMDQSDLLSYYKIGAIHGYPLTPWDGVGPVGNPSDGYCTHGSNLFGPWHRAYLALYEQQIHEWGVKIASQFTGNNSEAYRQASLTLRFPHLDWAANPSNNGPVLPDVLTNPTASVTYPNGSRANVPSPLYSYRFHPLVASDFQNVRPFSTWSETLRWPTQDFNTATSQNDQVELQFAANLPNFRTQIMTLFANWQPYNHLSNKGSGSSGFGNIESIHDIVHGIIGGFLATPGHMGFTQVASFDPIFMFHHANVDRILAIWEAIYPNTYVEAATQGAATYTFLQGSTQDQYSPLTPFHKDTNGSFFSSVDVRNIETLGYTYPELVNHPDNSTLKQTIAALYTGTPAPFKKRQAATGSLPRDYLVRIDLPWSALNATYSVGVFLGKSNAMPQAWAQDPAFVGMHATLGSKHMAPNDVIASGNVHLTDALLKKHAEGVLPDLNEDTIIKYLTANLEWKAQKGGKEIDARTLAGVVLTTQSIEVAAPKALGTFANFRWVGEFKAYPGCL